MDRHSLETLEYEMALFVRIISNISDRKIGNLDRSAYLLLHQLMVQGAVGVKDLAASLQLDVSTVSRQAAALDQKGYVVKLPDPQDGRAYFYHITEQGAKALLEEKKARADMIDKLLSDWSEEERRQFGEQLKKLNRVLKEYEEVKKGG
ncbi:putative HTH-type transcriptional regulator YxaD [Paenibacillus cisolokensis]|jgi:Transcriptional regulators|uniref:HTH-type transcriptional regulator YxaD n=1 Tax=Paenibacillus cisolokensis TaxID=1658519 RepID=A0ABQ4NFT0_9BACL|nr:MarR family transcriptional regulator [Paenibacillus cisolokensis]GIQ67118.1 putative HTH-type transcriptional regulator YxaD [Paenibacillus cisolokensis]